MSTWKTTKLYSIAALKCPRCHEGELFPKGTLYHPTRFSDMLDSCPCCGQIYDPEPGYYYGAMYVSFGFNTGIFLVVFAILSLLVEEVTFPMIMGTIIAVVIGFLPFTFRYSRAIWMNIFMHYEGPCNQIRRIGS